MGIGIIGGFENYGGLYGNYKAMNIKVVSEEEVKAQDAAAKKVQEETPVVQDYEKASRIAKLEDVSLSFNKNDDFGYLGSEADISQLDMDKAISDMKKDQVLEQYQYFVGPSGFSSEDGSVVVK